MQNSLIQPLSLVLSATDGQETFCSAFKLNGITFSNGSVERRLGLYISPPTRAVGFEVCQVVNNQTGFEPKVFFSGVNVEPKKFAFTPAQACDLASCARHEFGEKHFILLVEADGELFVLYVYRGGNHICARIAEFSDEQRWYQKNLRIVLRKQEPVVA